MDNPVKPNPEILIRVVDLEAMRDALETAYHKATAEDILASYPKLAQRVTHSALTKLLELAVVKADGYLKTLKEHDES